MANQKTTNALAAEQAQREQAELTSAAALTALNQMYDRFAPTRLVVTPPAPDAEGAELPAQPALPPEAVPLLKDLLRTYEEIAHSAGQFPKLQDQAAEANHRIGDIHQRLGQLEQAAAAFRTAIAIYSRRLAEAPGDVLRIKLARAYNELGRALRLLDRFDEARQVHQRAIQTLISAPRSFTDRPECRYELARSYYTLGRRDMFPGGGGPGPGRRGRPGDPGRGRPPGPGGFGKAGPPRDGGPPGRGPAPPDRDPVHQAIALLKQLVAEHPSVPEYKHLLACCYRDAPHEWFSRGQPSAGGSADQAVELLRRLVEDHPNVPDYRFDLCETLRQLSVPALFGGSESVDKDKERLKEADDLSAKLVRDYPNVPQYAASRAWSLDLLGHVLSRAEDLDGAAAAHRKAVEVQSKLAGDYPGVAAYGFGLSMMEGNLGRVLNERGELKEARSRLESAAARLEGLRKNDPRPGPAHPMLWRIYEELAKVLTRSGETALAAEARRKAESFGPGPGGRGGSFGSRGRGGDRP
jgi:tetratricopeptide (TPR) repeat protein